MPYGARRPCLNCWPGHIWNQILVSGTTLNLTPGQTQARVYELLQLHLGLASGFACALPAVEQATYQGRSRLSRVIVAVNVGVDPMLELSRKGLAKLSDKTDALGYADENQSGHAGRFAAGQLLE